jgi:hypothetical protein
MQIFGMFGCVVDSVFLLEPDADFRLTLFFWVLLTFVAREWVQGFMFTSMQATSSTILSRRIENAIDGKSQLCNSRMSMEFWRDASANQ